MKFYMTFIIAMLGIGLVTSTISAQDEINYTEMVEDLKVMCQIIDEVMDETFEDDYIKGGFFRRGGCQHLYLKGYGAMFLLDVRFPVGEKEMKVVKTEKKTDLWEKHEREVRHQSQPEEVAWVIGKNESYKKEKVDKLKEQLAYLGGEYGSRIGQLALDDTISFVVFGYPDYAVDLETDILDFEWHVGADAPVQIVKVQMEEEREKLKELNEKRQTLLENAEQILESKQKLEGTAEEESIEELREKTQEIREATKKLKAINRKLEGTVEEESRDDDKKVISRHNETIIIEEEDEEIEDSQLKKGKRLRLRIPVPPTPPISPSFPHRFRGKPATTLILTFKRSDLEGKKGTDWETLLEAAEVVEY